MSLAAVVDRDDLAPNSCMAGEREDRQRPTLTAGPTRSGRPALYLPRRVSRGPVLKLPAGCVAAVGLLHVCDSPVSAFPQCACPQGGRSRSPRLEPAHLTLKRRQLDVGMGGTERAAKQRQRLIPRRGTERDAQAPRLARSRAAGGLNGVLELLEDPPGAGEEHRPGIGEAHLPRGAAAARSRARARACGSRR